MNSIALIAFTERGCRLACAIARALQDRPFAWKARAGVGERAAEGGIEPAACFGAADGACAKRAACVWGPERFSAELGIRAYESLDAWTCEQFELSDALVFVGAAGIAVRAIAPHVRDKFVDPAVVGVDEAGAFAVPLLSGHVGGANELARQIAAITGGQAAVSTATDVNGLFAVDEWAAQRGLAIVERDAAKQVSAALLEGRLVGYATDFPEEFPAPEGLVETAGESSAHIGALVSLDDCRSPFPQTLHLVPRAVVVGVGCRRGTDVGALERAVDGALATARVSGHAVRGLASIDVKQDERALRELADARGWGLSFYSAEQLAVVAGEFASSEFVERTVGVANVCERAACAEGGELILGKRATDGVTVALASEVGIGTHPSLANGGRRFLVAKEEHEGSASRPPAGEAMPFAVEPGGEAAGGPRAAGGKLSVVGLGPGGAGDRTARASAALAACDLIVGYTTYLDLLRGEFPGKEMLATPMRKEVERCRAALEQASAGRDVALVCSGDAGVYGMAGLVLELAREFPPVEVEVVPGVSAANAGAAVLGAPLVHDFCVVSLSDALTPWETIEKRLAAAAQADFVICLYNPSSHKRPDHLRRACDVLLAHKGASTVCGTVRNIGRAGEEPRVMTLAQLRDAPADMFTTVFVGNTQTKVVDGRMVTPRGYPLEGA